MKYRRPFRSTNSLCHASRDGRHQWELRCDLEQPEPETVGDLLSMQGVGSGQKRIGRVCRACHCEEAWYETR